MFSAVEVQGFGKTTLRFGGIYWNLPHFNKEMMKDHNM